MLSKRIYRIMRPSCDDCVATEKICHRDGTATVTSNSFQDERKTCFRNLTIGRRFAYRDYQQPGSHEESSLSAPVWLDGMDTGGGLGWFGCGFRLGPPLAVIAPCIPKLPPH